MPISAIVSGGTLGIGLAIVEKLASEGITVITCSRNQNHVESLNKKSIENYGSRIHAFKADVSDKTEVSRFVQQAMEKVSSIHILVNNAGIFRPGRILDEPDGVFEEQIGINIASAYHLTRAVYPFMHKQDAYIFNMCSVASKVAYENGGSYCISKHGMLGFSKVLREELKSISIPVSSILPGATRTQSWDGTHLPPERFIKPENISEAIWMAWQQRKNCVFEELLIQTGCR